MTNVEKEMAEEFDAFFGPSLKKSDEIIARHNKAAAKRREPTMTARQYEQMKKDSERLFNSLFGDVLKQTENIR